VAPAIERGPFSYHRVNVEAQRRDERSLLHGVRRLMQARRALPHGEATTVDTGHPAVFGIRHHGDGRSVVALANLSDKPCTVGAFGRGTPDLAADQPYPPTATTALGPFGYRWFEEDP